MEDWQDIKRSKAYRDIRSNHNPWDGLRRERDSLLRACCRGCAHISLDGREIAEMPGRQKSVWDAREAIHERWQTHWLHSATKLPQRDGCQGKLGTAVRHLGGHILQLLEKLCTAGSQHGRNCTLLHLAKRYICGTHRETPSSSRIPPAPSTEEAVHYGHWQNEKYFKGLVLFLLRRQCRVDLEHQANTKIWCMTLVLKFYPIVFNIKFKSFTRAYQAYFIFWSWALYSALGPTTLPLSPLAHHIYS